MKGKHFGWKRWDKTFPQIGDTLTLGSHRVGVFEASPQHGGLVPSTVAHGEHEVPSRQKFGCSSDRTQIPRLFEEIPHLHGDTVVGGGG